MLVCVYTTYPTPEYCSVDMSSNVCMLVSCCVFEYSQFLQVPGTCHICSQIIYAVRNSVLLICYTETWTCRQETRSVLPIP